MTETALVWFRRDLRLHDNESLSHAVTEADQVLPLYCFDPRMFEATTAWTDHPRVGPLRARFVRESVVDLRSRLRERGGDVLVHHGDPRSVVPEVAAAFDADVVHCQTLPGTEERATETAVRDALEAVGVDMVRHWTHTLYRIADLPTTVADVADTFTPWKQTVEAEATVGEPLAPPTEVDTPTFDSDAIPTLAALGYDPTEAEPGERATMRATGGETAALERLRTYVFERDCLREYKETRNGLLGMDFSSKLSPWLAQGSLSPRRVHETVTRYERDRVANESTYWLLFELRWRDYFQFQFAKHGASYFQPGGIRDRSIDWRHEEADFQRWVDGRTGFPLVDAAMRELAASGYQSNRSRQNAASFLANTLGIDWRWGAAYYESQLLDYDVASNYGNWAYLAGVGTDSRDRAFDVRWQAATYDPDAEYVSHWLPELAELPPAQAQEPWRLTDEEREAYGIAYPDPMVDPDRFEGT